MQAPPMPHNEARRLEAVRRYEILDTPAEAEFDDLTLMAAEICETPVGLITLVDSDRQWFKSRVGLDAAETTRSISFCGHVILSDDLFEVADARADHRFADNPLVAGGIGIRFYAGVPLVTSDGLRLGTLCVIDRVPRTLTDRQRRALTGLSRQVVRQLEARLQARQVAQHAHSQAALLASQDLAVIATGAAGRITGFNAGAEAMLGSEYFLQTLLDALPVGVYAKRLDAANPAGTVDMLLWNRAAERILGINAAAIAGGSGYDGFASEIAAVQLAHDKLMLETRQPVVEPAYPVRHADGKFRMLRISSVPLLDAHGGVAYAIGIAEDITELKEAELEIVRATRVDHLTLLPNRARFFEVLESAIARGRRLNSGIAVVFIDIDQFHKLNDAAGVAKGDEVLQEFARRLKGAVRATDTVARLASDEFVVILENLHAVDQAEAVTQKIFETLGRAWLLDGEPLALRFSAGVAFDHTHAHSAAALIGYADELLYVAKSAGGNTHRITVC